MSSDSSILTILTKSLEGKVRYSINRRVEAMRRNLQYLMDSEDERLLYIIKKGFSYERLDVVCCLNSFYQIVLGPLTSSAYSKNINGLGKTTPILYGNIKFDHERSNELLKTHSAFRELLSRLEIPIYWLYMNRVDELIFDIWKKKKEDDHYE